ncbi:hypothetical protein ACIP8I_05160 [Pseudomonas sp. NPDC088414]|uniref:hypothetical protein n=1 Tax=Pseudomonas sp. NPDC088414 TaxID=3364454 RepID=UPI00380E47E1
MLVQPKKAIGTRALLDPEIPGAKLLPDGKWAINRAAALLNFPALGLKVQLPVWSNKDLGDKVELLLNNVPVDQQTVTQPAEQTQRTTLFVAPGRFQTGAWELAYRVTRVAQQPEPFAPPLQLAVKLEIPAGQDTNPEQGHSNLHMAFRPPEIVQDGVDKDTAEKGVDIVVNAVPGSGSNLPYPDIAVGDVIIASWGGKLVASAPVTQAQIDDPLNNPIVIHISKDIILAAGDSGNEGLAVSFFVRDFVDNDSEDWCKEARIVVDTGNSRLDAPILKQADGNELDLDQLGNEQLLLQVFAASSDDFKLGDIIIMHLQGTTLDGDPVAVDARQRVDKNPPLVVEVPMDNDGARALAKTQGVFFFDLERDGRIIQRSRGRFINMKGEPKRLAAPIVESAVSGALDPDLANVIVRIPYDPLITPDNAIELLWSITLADGTVFEPELDWIFPTEDEASNPGGFPATVRGPDYLKPGEGGTLKVSYNLLSEGENDEVIRRPSLPAAPLNIGEPRLELVPPILLGEQDGALEPKDLPNGISEVTCPNPVNNPTLPKDGVHWQLHDASNKLLFEDHKTLNALSAGKDVKFPLNAAFVQQYFEARRGEQLSVRYHIVREATGKISYSNPLVFVVGEVVELVPPTIDSVKGLPGEVEIPDGGTTVDTMVKLSGAGAKGQKVQIKDGTTVKGTADVDPQRGDWELAVTDLSLGDHRFTAIALYGNEQVSDPWVVVVTAPLAPTVRGQTGNTFKPTLPEIVVLIPGASLLHDDKLSVQWTGATAAAGGSHTSPLQLVSEGLQITVPLSVLAFSLGKTVTVTYTVIRSAVPRTSLPLLLNIEALPDSSLILPVILDADNNGAGPQFDVSKLTANATYRMGVWPLIATGQYVWLRLKGTNTDGSDYNLQIHTAPGSMVSTQWLDQGYYERSIALAGLRNLKDGSTLRMEFKAAFGKSTNESEAVVFPVRTYMIKAFEDVRPAITGSKDSKEVAIAEGAITVDTQVKLEGTGAKGQKVQIKDANTVKGEATVNLTTGLWELTMTGLSLAAHSFTATALYGIGQVSTPWTLTVTANTALTITSVKDQSNWSIPDNGHTVHTSVTLTGSAPIGQKVEVFLGTISKGFAEAGPDGIWTHTVSELALNVLHSLKAVGQYANNPTSNLWRLTALNGVAPAITAAHDSNGQPINNGGNTVDRTVHLTGTANTFLEVEIFDGATSTGKKDRADDKGEWTVELTGLSIARHDYKAKALYGSGTESEVWALTVTDSAAPIFVDPSTMFLRGVRLINDYGWARKPETESVRRREATGGVPPYKYTSTVPAIASVTDDGIVTGLREGSTVIWVRDQNGAQAQFHVQCSEITIYKVVKSSTPVPGTYAAISGWIASVRGVTNEFLIRTLMNHFSIEYPDASVVLNPSEPHAPWPYWAYYFHSPDSDIIRVISAVSPENKRFDSSSILSPPERVSGYVLALVPV